MVWNGPHIHLIFNHVPVIGLPFATVLLMAALWKADISLERAAHWSFLLVSLLAILVYISGSYAEDYVIQNLGVTHDIIGPHHDAAQYSFVATLMLGGLSLVTLLFHQRLQNILNFNISLISLLGGALTSALLAWTANLGGKIRHPEIRPAGWMESIEHSDGHGASDSHQHEQ